MANIKANGISLYYETYGEGTPLVLIEGLGYATWMWYKQIAELSQFFKVIVFDNRGVGKSDKPDMEYTIELMADDIAELLDGLSIDRAHMIGVAMGGCIAQEFALKYPDMVDKLILCSTTYGGPNSVSMSSETFNIILKGGGDCNSDREIRRVVETAFNKETRHKHQETIAKIMTEKIRVVQPKYAYQRQLMAGAAFNGEDRVNRIKAETLILAGKRDSVVPWENAILLHNKIAHSKLRVIEEAGHVFFIEKPNITNKLIIDFLNTGGITSKKHKGGGNYA